MSTLTATGARSCAQALVRPVQLAKPAPCMLACAAGNNVRQWIGVIAQRGKLGLSRMQAYAQAWRVLSETNPFPATLGRICPRPCEAACNRMGKDGAVSINAMERFLGDWALEQAMALGRLDGPPGASVGIVGSGPSGLSCAYQLARRGHRVTVYEKEAHPGGMLRYGIPAFRLPKAVLQGEIDRIIRLGVELRLQTAVGPDISLDAVRTRHDALFLAVGAGSAARLGIPGEDGSNVLAGIDFLAALHRGELRGGLEQVVVVGGGNTAIDAARAARRQGARVTVLYRRTRAEMPAAASEVDDALAEGVSIEYLAVPTAIHRQAAGTSAVQVQRMKLDGADRAGRRAAVPLPGETFRLIANMVIVAVSQTVDWRGLEALRPEHGARIGEGAILAERIRAGGDVLAPGIAAAAIAQGRNAAESLHGALTAAGSSKTGPMVEKPARDVASDFYASCAALQRPARPVADRMRTADLEVHETISEAAFLREVERCFSCGQCHGCRHCAMYCNVGAFIPQALPVPGAYFSVLLERCTGCAKCIELCPTGFLQSLPACPQSPR